MIAWAPVLFMVKRIPFIIFSFIFFTGIFILLNNIISSSSKPTIFSQNNAVYNKPNPSLEVKVGLPKKLIIPKLGVNTIVESVAMDSEGRMDVPKNVENVAWYNLGPKPGLFGSAVLAGHFDKVTGAPAVFFDLDKLKVGDEIISVDEFNKEYKFKVVDKRTYIYNQVPLEQVFNSNDKSRLNLITCGGQWIATQKNYSNRTVIYSELVN